MECPTCGHTIHAAPDIYGLRSVRLSPSEAKMLEILSDIYPMGRSISYFVEALYSHDPNGGPLQPRSVVAIFAHRLRQKLKPYNWTVSKSKGGIYSVGFYKLEKTFERTGNCDGFLPSPPKEPGKPPAFLWEEQDMKCPTCGQTIHAALDISGLISASLSPSEEKMLVILSNIYPNGRSISDFVDALYSDDPDGGPLQARNIVAKFAHHLRRKLEPHNWTVSKSKGGIYSRGFYKLEKTFGDRQGSAAYPRNSEHRRHPA
jgi:predicted transcriptional regulator with HTH domain